MPWSMFRDPPLLHAAVQDYEAALRGYSDELSRGGGGAAGLRAARGRGGVLVAS